MVIVKRKELSFRERLYLESSILRHLPPTAEQMPDIMAAVLA